MLKKTLIIDMMWVIIVNKTNGSEGNIRELYNLLKNKKDISFEELYIRYKEYTRWSIDNQKSSLWNDKSNPFSFR